MKDILSEIIAHKQTEIELQKQTVSLEQLQEQAGIIIRENAAHRRSMKQALAASSTGIISEFKRRSPSKGWINEAAGRGNTRLLRSRRRRRPLHPDGWEVLRRYAARHPHGPSAGPHPHPAQRLHHRRVPASASLHCRCRCRIAHCLLPQSGAVQHPHRPSPRTRAGGIARNPQPFGTLLYK